MDRETLNRAEGCLLGQLVGDALGSQVEFSGPEAIACAYPQGVRDLRDGGFWNTLAGQPTDDSELALMLARMLIKQGRYDPEKAMEAYRFWLRSGAFDVGNTVRSALTGHLIESSQANGTMMRSSPLGIFAALRAPGLGAETARADAALTHPNRVCLETNALYVSAIALAVRTPVTPAELYQKVLVWWVESNCSEEVRDWIEQAATSLPASFEVNQGWVK